MPRRRGRLRGRARRVRRPGARALRRLPGRQPRPRRPRRARHLLLLRGRSRGGRVDARKRRRARTLEFLRTLEPSGEREGIGLFHASPRDPVWEYVLSARAGRRRDGLPPAADRADRPLSRRPLLQPPRGRGIRRDQGRAGRRRRPARPRSRRLAGQPRQRRPAPRRRSARRLAGARHRGGDRLLPPGPLRRSRRRRTRSRPPAFPSASPTACTSGSEAYLQGKPARQGVL